MTRYGAANLDKFLDRVLDRLMRERDLEVERGGDGSRIEIDLGDAVTILMQLQTALRDPDETT